MSGNLSTQRHEGLMAKTVNKHIIKEQRFHSDSAFCPNDKTITERETHHRRGRDTKINPTDQDAV